MVKRRKDMSVDKYGHELKSIDLTTCEHSAPDLFEVYCLFCDKPDMNASVEKVLSFFYMLRIMIDHDQTTRKLESN